MARTDRSQPLPSALSKARELVIQLRTSPEFRHLVRQLIERFIIGENNIAIHVDPNRLGSILGLPCDNNSLPFESILLSAEFGRTPWGQSHAIAILPASQKKAPHPILIKTVVRAHGYWRRLRNGKVRSLEELALGEGVDKRHLQRTVRLVFLAPDIIESLLADTQPDSLPPDKLLKINPFPHDWDEQWRAFGFA